MKREQKIALLVLITLFVGLLVGITAILSQLFDAGIPKIAFISTAAILFCGVIISLKFIKKDKGAVTFDERDKIIVKNANLAGFGAVYLLVILVSYVPLAIAPEARIPTTWFAFLLPTSALCHCLAWSLAILIQYGWRDKDGDK